MFRGMYDLHVVDMRPLGRASHVGADQPVGDLEAHSDSDATRVMRK